MKVHTNKTAGLIIIDDLEDNSVVEVRDPKGGLIHHLFAVTPSFTLDIERWIDGWYELIAINNRKSEVVKFLVSH